jgi:hypothetical protein
MLGHTGSSISTIVGALIVCAFVAAGVRAALLFDQGLEQGSEVRPKNELQGIFSKDV